MNVKLIYVTVALLALVLLLPASALATTTETKVFVGGGITVHEADLKATESANGQVIPVSGFEIEPEDIVQIPRDQNLMIFLNDNGDSIKKVKVTDTDGVQTELFSNTGNAYSIQSLETGTYILDVIVDTGAERAAYETILVVLEPGEEPESPTKIINNVNVKTIVKTVVKFDDDNDDDDNDNDGRPPIRCGANAYPIFKDGKWLCHDELDDNPCLPGQDPSDGRCEPEPEPEPIICRHGQDESDGCKPKPGPEPRPVCTPDGPPCPPCPEGVEAGWCQDEDEIKDTDDELPEEEEEVIPPVDEEEETEETEEIGTEEEVEEESEETETESESTE